MADGDTGAETAAAQIDKELLKKVKIGTGVVKRLHKEVSDWSLFMEFPTSLRNTFSTLFFEVTAFENLLKQKNPGEKNVHYFPPGFLLCNRKMKIIELERIRTL